MVVITKEAKTIDWAKFRSIEDNGPTLPLIYSIQKERDDIVLIGGHTTNPELLGWRYFRKPSAGIDFVITNRVLNYLLLYHELIQDSQHRDNYCLEMLDNTRQPRLLYFFTGNVGDYLPSSDFLRSQLSIPTSAGKILVASQEHVIALKLIRDINFANSGIKQPGRDAIDIANIFLAPKYREGLKEPDIDKVVRLVRGAVSGKYTNTLGIYNPKSLETSLRQLNQEEKDVYKPFLESLVSSLKGLST